MKGPKHVVKTGKTPALTAKEAAELLESIDTTHVVGLRDRALLSTMVYSFARVSAVINMQVKDYFAMGKRYWFRLHEKGGKYHEVPAHHIAEEWLDRYLFVAGIGEDKDTPLFRSTLGKTKELTDRPMARQDVYRMIQDLPLLSTPHAGEIAPSPGGGPASVRTAVTTSGADLQVRGHDAPRSCWRRRDSSRSRPAGLAH